MFITFYGSDFKPLADNSSLAIEKFTITKRSYDLNSFDAVCEPISIDIVPYSHRLKQMKEWFIMTCCGHC